MLSGHLNPLEQNVDIDGLTVGRRVFKLELNELDELNIDIRLADGSLGNLLIKASTLAQIIMDRNFEANKVPEPSTVTEIQVGDGTDDGNVGGSKIPLRMVHVDELLMASRKRNFPTPP